MGSIMITKMTGRTTVFGMPSRTASAVFGLGLNTCVASVASRSVVSGLGNDEGTRVETGLSLDWATFEGGLARNERPTQAPKAAAAAVKHGGYGAVIGAGAAKKQDEQQISKMRAFRGPEPWRERT